MSVQLLHRLVNDPVISPVGHTAALVALVASWSATLTTIASLALTLLAGGWYLVALYETKTVQHFIGEWSEVRLARRAYKEGWSDRALEGHVLSSGPAKKWVTPTAQEAYELGYKARDRWEDKP